ncbi:MAG: CYTH domain-containing protein [Oxalicibacterium faecigallinarum]|uniref:CYTH domain-containing protein n=1 Tax=Oxalicibacterium faecigallinarum TaxID=573741 RepID=UPI002809F5BB|nr:CYTH domain-containing protein [Oxalicibacterium faecigallinarum]MDQ7970603.1 CYTH domain-containing protein [Oxalicibacterium faecigallinarum]
MSVEIERKFLVVGDAWKSLGTATTLRQGYLSSHPDRVVRVRVEGQTATLTIKGKNQGISRGEWEYDIPLEEANALLSNLCERPLIEKMRTRITHAGMVWEVDAFSGDNAGLVVAEIELESETQRFDKPDWIGAEVSDDPRYFNANLLKHPFSKWEA